MSVVIGVLDACTLFPASLRGTLLEAASEGLYQPRWNQEILNELERNLVRTGRCTAPSAERLVTRMASQFPEAMVQDNEYQRFLPSVTNHPKDRHVTATALAGGASVVVTQNIRDFSPQALDPFHLKAVSPDTFLTDLFVARQRPMTRAVLKQTARLTNPPLSLEAMLTVLEKHAPIFVEYLRASHILAA